GSDPAGLRVVAVLAEARLPGRGPASPRGDRGHAVVAGRPGAAGPADGSPRRDCLVAGGPRGDGWLLWRGPRALAVDQRSGRDRQCDVQRVVLLRLLGGRRRTVGGRSREEGSAPDGAGARDLPDAR